VKYNIQRKIVRLKTLDVIFHLLLAETVVKVP